MKILIVGAGIAGLTLADQLDREGYSVQIIEKAPGLRTEGYMMDFFGAGYDVAEKMGLLKELEKIHYPIEALKVKRADGTTKYSLNYQSLRQLLNDRHFNFMRGDLERVLYERIKDRVPVTYSTTIESLQQDEEGILVELSNETKLNCDLLVGADGIHSKVRKLVFGEEENYVHSMGYQTVAFTFDKTSKYNKTDHTFDTITEPGRQVSIYPIMGNRIATFFLFSNKDGSLKHHSHEEGIKELKKHFGDMGWVVPDILQESEKVTDFYFDDVAQTEMTTWTKGRVALVGDACGCVSLVAGQGSSLAMAGAYSLARCLGESKSNIKGALAEYNALMVPQVTKIQKSARKFASFFFPESKWKLMIRDITMRASVMPIIRNFMKFKSIRVPK
ncbi:FAD-dependent monooxygenase [Fictibacillus enclensis]|uniref:FAD-dependent monooxygenase n=1 Tax=Fictibacillus enclensis TaxID=1017270 RepID=UPI0025A079C5|nr:FAD-dependent monooxygenase [Fictibacillus enclensis]MDM5197239.1 FAD-dependent monooxygenase [Fictibacillus enclensis]